MSVNPDGVVELPSNLLAEFETKSNLSDLAEQDFLSTTDSRYLGPYRFGKDNFVLEDMIFRIDPNDVVTGTMLVHWGKMKTIQPQRAGKFGPTINVTLLDKRGVPVGSEWNLGQVNQTCGQPLRWRFTKESTITGAFENAVALTVAPATYNWWYC